MARQRKHPTHNHVDHNTMHPNHPPTSGANLKPVRTRRARWYHAVVGIFVLAWVVGLGIYHFQPHPTPSHAASVGGAGSINSSYPAHIEFRLNAPANISSVQLIGTTYAIGDCENGEGGPVAFTPWTLYNNGDNTDGAICNATLFGPASGQPAEIDLDTSLPGYTTTVEVLARGGVGGNGDILTCNGTPNVSYCDVNFDTGDAVIEFFVTQNATPTPTPTATPSACPAPTNFHAVAVSSSQINLSWAAPSCADVIGYNIERGSTNISPGNATSYSDSFQLSPSTTYTYKIAAVQYYNNNAVIGAYSAPVSASTLAAATPTPATPTPATPTPATPTPPLGGSGGGGGGGPPSNPPTGSGTTTPITTPTAPVHTPTKTSSGGGSSGGGGGSTSTAPPGTPNDFTSSLADNDTGVNLDWEPSTSGSPATSYELDRSTDGGTTWESLDSNIIGTSYADLDTSFGVHYYYRLLAIDASNQASGYAYTDISTSSFKSNAAVDSSTTLKSPDGLTTVTIPAGALSQPATCGLDLTRSLASPKVTGWELAAGPYTVTCKGADGSLVEFYNEPLQVTINTGASAFKKFGRLAYYTQSSSTTKWELVESPTTDKATHTVKFTISDGFSYVVLGQPKHLSGWIVLLIWLVILALIIWFLFWLLGRRRQTQEDTGLYRKDWGVL